MDPLSIAATILRITTTCVSAAKTLNDIRNAWKLAPATVSSLCSQLKLTSASLSQIQHLLLEDTDVLQDRPDIIEAFDTALTACLVSSTWLEKYMQSITKGVLSTFEGSWKLSFKTLWNEHEVRELSGQLHTQQSAIGVVVGLLQIHSSSDIKRTLRKHERLLRDIARNTKLFRQAHAIDAPESILGTNEANESVFSTFLGATDPQETNHLGSFEAVVLNTKVYSNAVNGLLRKENDLEYCDKTSTVAGRISSEAIATPTSSLLPSMDPKPLPPKIAFAMRELGVRETVAVSVVDCTAVDGKGLSLGPFIEMNNVQKIDNLWYLGQINDSTGVGLVGRFRRDQVLLEFCLSNPIVTETKDAILGFSRHGRLSPSKVQKLKVQSMYSEYLGECMTMDDFPLPIAVSMTHLVIDREVRRAFDTLVDYFACTQSDLESSTTEELERRMHMALAKKWTSAELTRIKAHCKSLAELHMIGRVYTELRKAKGYDFYQ